MRFAPLASLFAVSWLAPAAVGADEPKKDASPMLFELRTYVAEPGKMADLNARFRDHTLRLFAKHGIVNVLYGTRADQPDTLIYLLAHKDREAAGNSWAAFKEDPEWKEAAARSEVNGKLVKKVDVQYLVPTDYSPIKSAANEPSKAAGEPQVFELRIYTTEEGKLPNLNARFRDHTVRLFEKHGMKNLVYGVPTDEKLKDNTLVYFLAHKSREAADKSWSDFQNDPEWKAARDASEKEGKILVQGGVKRVYLTPTDYSPRK